MSELKLSRSTIEGRYEVIERMGQGSYAEIFSARDLTEQQLVIIKALNCHLQGTADVELEESLRDNFSNEATALDTVKHKNIIRRLDQGQAIDERGCQFPYLVLEYMPGGDLLRRCRQQRLNLDEMLYYITQICDALSYAHKCNVIHRDIKPNNLLLSEDTRIVKIADFGVAKIAPQADEEVTRVGTDVYAPPEHHPLAITDELVLPKLTPSADIYALAKTIYTLMTGSAPRQFRHRAISFLPAEIAGEQWAEALMAVLNRATATRIEERYASVSEFYRDLKEVPSLSQEVTLVRPRVNKQNTDRADNQINNYNNEGINRRGKAVAQQNLAPHPPSRTPSPPGRIVVPIPQQPKPSPAKPVRELERDDELAANNGANPEKFQIKNGSTPIIAKAPSDAAVAQQRNTAGLSKDGQPAKNKTADKKVAAPKTFWDHADEFLFKHRKTILIVWAIVLFIGMSVWIYSVNYQEFQPGATLGQSMEASVTKDVLLRSGPSTATEIVGWLPRGSKLEIVRQDPNNWVFVKVLDQDALKTANAPSGWIYGDYVRTRTKPSQNGREDEKR
jgi:serine/threonine protein kinase